MTPDRCPRCHTPVVWVTLLGTDTTIPVNGHLDGDILVDWRTRTGRQFTLGERILFNRETWFADEPRYSHHDQLCPRSSRRVSDRSC